MHQAVVRRLGRIIVAIFQGYSLPSNFEFRISNIMPSLPPR
jgi:hypothetical protein